LTNTLVQQGAREMPDQNQEVIEQEETLSSEVVALCQLLARILMRCLREKDPYVMDMLSLTPPSEEGELRDAA
jgi:hypothetical protein